ncbi:MAG: MobA/MobL family protein [Mediterraneibacter gnavus]
MIAQAAYRSGKKLYGYLLRESSDFTRKRGVVMAEICLPDHAPGDMLTGKLCGMRWNGQSRKKAQLAHSFDITLMNEFSMEKNIEMARAFVRKNWCPEA